MKALLKNQKYIVAIFLTTLLFIGTFSAGYIQAQNVGEPITLEIVPVSERTPQVRDAIVAAVPDVDAAADVTETHLAGITALYLNDRNITSLKSGDFDGLTGLEELLLYGNQLTSLPADIFSGLSSLRTLRFGLNQITSLPDGLFDGVTALTDLRMIGNRLTSLPDGIFEGLTGLTQLRLGSNAVNPLPLTISLEKVADGQFKAVAPTGAPFDIVLPLNITNGTFSDPATTITIPKGRVESETIAVTRTPGTTFATSVNIGTLPGLPANHSGYTLIKSDDLPLAFPELGGAVVTPVCDRNPAVIQAIDLRALFDPNVCSDITEADLAAIEFLSIDIAKQPLKVGDFDGLSALTVITIERSQGLTISEGAISNLPALTQIWIETSDNAIISEGAISNLPALTDIWIETSQGVTISEGAFSNLPALTTVRLEGNRLTVLPEGIFSGLTSLTTLDLGSNELTSLPDGIFEGLTALTTLNLTHNNLTTLPEGIFSDLTALISLNLRGNQLTALPKGIFNGLSSLTTLQFEYNRNELTTLPDGIFEGLTSITKLWMYGGTNTSLPLNVSLEKVGDNQFKAVAPSGAPFNIVLPLNVTNGTISGGATTITIPAGSVESDTLTVTRNIGTSGAVSVQVGPLPSLPTHHAGYRLVANIGRFNRLIIFEDISEQVWSGTITIGTWRNDFGNGNATGYGYSRHHNAGSISNPNFTYRGTTYTIHGISISRIGNNLPHQFSLLISPRFPACDKKVLAIRSFRLSEAGEGNAYGASWYMWHGPWTWPWRVTRQMGWGITLHPTVPDAPVVTAINEGNQVMLSWTTPCDGDIDITGHEYRQRIGSGTFGPWIPIPNSAAGEANSTSYTVTNVSNPLESTFEVRAVNELGPSLPSNVAYPVSLGFIPVSERTPQVRDAIVAAVPGVNSAAEVTEAHLAAITQLHVNNKSLTSLKAGDFSGLIALTELNLSNNQL
ncbi:leucine-rich repeat protein, partial [Candidatus Poribacteria bacterium]|nr:leucine-rich repeat protein [Candidatus Poribacteria bacterium]